MGQVGVRVGVVAGEFDVGIVVLAGVVLDFVLDFVRFDLLNSTDVRLAGSLDWSLRSGQTSLPVGAGSTE